MEFESEEAAMLYYDVYAKRVGFIIQLGNCHHSSRDGSIVSRRFLCNKEEFRVNNKKTKRLEVRKPREVTREGCKAMIMVRSRHRGNGLLENLKLHIVTLWEFKLARVVELQFRPDHRMRRMRKSRSYRQTSIVQINNWQSASSNWKWF